MVESFKWKQLRLQKVSAIQEEGHVSNEVALM